MNPPDATTIRLLWQQAWANIQTDNPELVPVIRDGVADGRNGAHILADCRAIEPAPGVLDRAKMAMLYLRQEARTRGRVIHCTFDD